MTVVKQCNRYLVNLHAWRYSKFVSGCLRSWCGNRAESGLISKAQTESDGHTDPRCQKSFPQKDRTLVTTCSLLQVPSRHRSVKGRVFAAEGRQSQNTFIKPLENIFYPSTLSSFCIVAPSLLLTSPPKSH